MFSVYESYYDHHGEGNIHVSPIYTDHQWGLEDEDKNDYDAEKETE
ncbi:MAG: hypothetical protein KBS66_06185 [Eubacterium sp.]|nr:hypothetical protein [Candidatus Colimonas fimequi]